MRLYAGLTFEQMAEALAEPLSTVSSRYRRAVEHLREKMEPKL
jgi:DNA-directed RNA polymerase specialized sigma24 family protein